MQKSITLFDTHDNLIQLGPKLGTGGEGAVFEINSNLVAKIYHQPLPTAKQNKLLAMSNTHTPSLLEISTWPIGTIHLGKQGPVGGLVMPKLVGYKEIHKLYGPAHRKTEFPSADWTFLIQVARNTAASIATLHQAGYVVGDINPGNLAVSPSALTKLIDCDSFQIKYNGQYYPCEVGVAHFTPPELQGKSFNNVVRTPNHDNFGLALLCFHLLFMGRHPFAGKYKNGTEDMPIEKAIREFRFAYGTKATSKGMSSPPNTLLLSTVGEELSQMFEIAFDQGGVFNGRPAASHWVKALDKLKSSLIVCTRYSPHKFYRALSDCPWCALEASSGTIFFLPTDPVKTRPVLDLNRLWQQILGVTPPDVFPLPKFTFTCSPQPLPNFLLAPDVRSKDYVQEAEQRHSALVKSEAAWNYIQKQWSKEVDDAEFAEKLAELKNVYDRLLNLNAQFKNSQQQLEVKTKQLQLHSYLEKQHIDSAKISGIGMTRKATLASYGIETAADIDQTKIMSIPGFGLSLAINLVQWRNNLESKFVYNSHKVTPSVETMKLLHQYNITYAPLESALLAGAEELRLIKEKINEKRKTFLEEAEKRASAYEQARVNWLLLKHNLEQVQRQEKYKLVSEFANKLLSDVSKIQTSVNTSATQPIATTAASQPGNESFPPQTLSNHSVLQTSNQLSLHQTTSNIATSRLDGKASVSPNHSNTFSNKTGRLSQKTKFKLLDFILVTIIVMLLYFSAIIFYKTKVYRIDDSNSSNSLIEQKSQPKPTWTPMQRTNIPQTPTSTTILRPTLDHRDEPKVAKTAIHEASK